MSRTPGPTPDLANLAACAEDLRRALAERRPAPAGRRPGPAGRPRRPGDVRAWPELRRGLRRATGPNGRLPRAYQRSVVAPLLTKLGALGPAGLRRMLRRPEEQLLGACLLDLANAVLQARGSRAIRALQEVVGDLYDGFLAAERRDGVAKPEGGTLAPLVKWGRPELGPYTWPVTWARQLGAGAGVVCLPPAAARRGLLLWAALSHETAGHDLLAADEGLRGELARVVRRALGPRWAGRYWADRIEEAASDVLGILNMGPVVALAIVLHLRALRAAAGEPARLRGRGAGGERHPAEAARGYLGAAVVRALGTPGAEHWAVAIEAEVDRDVRALRLGAQRFTRPQAKRLAAKLAAAIVHTPLRRLERHTLAGIQSWGEADERVVLRLRRLLEHPGRTSARLGAGTYAAHAVAAAVTSALAAGGDPARCQRRMIALLAAMNRREPRWARRG